MTTTRWRVAVAGFDHMHAGDQISIALGHPAVDLVGLWDTDRARMESVAADLGVDDVIVSTDLDEMLDVARPEIVIVCSTTFAHEELVAQLAPRDVHIILEKPFAVSIEAADRMIDAVAAANRSGASSTLSINWPLAWYPAHRTTQRLIAEGVIGNVVEVHYFNGNRGPLHHVHGKADAHTLGAKAESWWYRADVGGGSLLDYLGYGVTLATWFRGGELPLSVTARAHGAPELEVDERSVVIAEYETGLSVFQTKWGTFTDPWTIQPLPRHGFVVVGDAGAIASDDYAAAVQVQTVAQPQPHPIAVDELPREEQTALGYLIGRLDQGAPLEGPSSWQVSRGGQAIVDAARRSVREGITVALARAEVTA